MHLFITIMDYFFPKELWMKPETKMENGKIFILMEKYRQKASIQITEDQASGNSITHQEK